MNKNAELPALSTVEQLAALGEKRYQLTIGVHIAPSVNDVIYAGPNFYGKLKYEDAVLVQSTVLKHKQVLDDALLPIVHELMELGITQAKAVSDVRSTDEQK
jgi:hypothetical protein